MKKVSLMAGAVLVIGGLLFWQLYPKQASSPFGKPTGKLMKVAKYYWPGEFWIEIADAKGWFNEAGLNVELIDTNPNWYQSLQDLADGKLDVNAFALFGLMDFRAKGADLVMVLYTDSSSGSEAIVARNSIKSIKDLRGKSIAVKKNDYTEYILDSVLKKNSLTLNDVKLVDVVGEKAHQAFIDGKVDAFVSWEPLVTEGIKKGKGRKLFDTSQIPGISPNGQTFHRKFIEQRPEDVQAFVTVWHQTTEFIKTHPKEAFGIIAKIYKTTPEEVQAFAEVDKIMDLSDNIKAFQFSSGFRSLHGAARKINTYMIGRGIASEEFDSTEFLDPSFIRNLVQEAR